MMTVRLGKTALRQISDLNSLMKRNRSSTWTPQANERQFTVSRYVIFHDYLGDYFIIYYSKPFHYRIYYRCKPTLGLPLFYVIKHSWCSLQILKNHMKVGLLLHLLSKVSYFTVMGSIFLSVQELLGYVNDPLGCSIPHDHSTLFYMLLPSVSLAVSQSRWAFFPQISIIFFLIFPQTFLIFFLILSLRAGYSPGGGHSHMSADIICLSIDPHF